MNLPRSFASVAAARLSLRAASLLGCLLALAVAMPASAREARGTLTITATVVHATEVKLAVAPDAKVMAPRTVKGGTEWTVPLQTGSKSQEETGVRFQVKDCEGAQASLSQTRNAEGNKGLTVFVPRGSQCAPIVVATVFPDGTPEGGQELDN